MQKSLRDIIAGVIFIGFGFAFAIASLGYDLGTALRMGPGFFPLALAILLMVIGGAIAAKALFDAGAEPLGAIPWRGLLLLLAAPIMFGLTIRGLGLAPALFVTTVMSALASRRTSPPLAILLAALLTLFCVAIFIYGLGITVPVFGPWLGD
ncbi:tripartite tricarboxylate transporter TctB family protein [Rhodoligotrophos defluvii]|uniref:tripartite tricarboxylate transporter TctB family protein n=1 Tax=Rhodoligotrophos defluvii TaxID=2561934 RepID=UPI0010C9EBC3|nr:tripartite tricarboxylate transporter TctB family protein [Rhodoligotrophos defluvii]